MTETAMVTLRTGSTTLAQMRAHEAASQCVEFLGSDWVVSAIRVDKVAPTLTLVWLAKVTPR